MKKILLTIDDTPSSLTDRRIEVLQKHNIPAVFFARGEFIKKNKQQLINVIKSGYLVGNHLYSHPYFSKITFRECVKEINKTEELIDECYFKADVKRSRKIIRFPFGDRGGDNEQFLQDFLKESGFVNGDILVKVNDKIDLLWD